MNLSYSDFIQLKIEQCDEHTNFSTFLVDTEAGISIIKLCALKQSVNFDESNTISIKGVTENFVRTLGTIQL